jgi:hypothetical protein
VSTLLVNNFTLYDDREPEYSEPLVEKARWRGVGERDAVDRVAL